MLKEQAVTRLWRNHGREQKEIGRDTFLGKGLFQNFANMTIVQFLAHEITACRRTPEELNQWAFLIPPHDSNRVAFALRQLLDTVSPSNFPWLNPEVIRRTRETGGRNLVQGE